MANTVYTPAPSVVPFLTADKFSNFIVGPVGSSKTTAAIMKIAYEAKRIAKCHDGVRRSRCAVIRNTRQMLYDATIPDFVKWYPDGPAGTMQKTESKFILRFDDVECEVLFRGLDDANDVRRLLSLQLSFGFMDEFREIHPDIYNALTGRLGRYPDKTMNGVGCCDDAGNQIHKVWGATNPPDMDSFWEKILTEPPKNMHVTIQPSGLSPDADWTQFLPDGYYENLCEGKTEDWIDNYVHGKFGRTLVGKPVYDRTFNEEFHVAKTPLIAFNSASHPIVIGMDFGRTPAATIGQRNAMGQILVYDELVSENMGLEQFIVTKLKPLLASRFPGMPYLVAGDPAGWAKSQINEESCADVLKKAGFRAVRPSTNAIAPRLRAVETLLLRQVNGKAAFLIDPSCTQLIKGFRSGYKYKAKKDGSLDETPDKNEHSHLADSCQYFSMLIEGAVSGVHQNQARETVAVNSGGWT
jgi:hypothetical protein